MSHAVQSPAPAIGPITTRERILTLDVLRGIALFGVLVSNIWLDFSGLRFTPVAMRAEWPILDTVVDFVMSVLVKGKAMSTFSFLFGLGFAVQMLRAEEHGVAIVPLYRRRLAVLFSFGAAHALMLWWGDILHIYALLGFALLLFRHRSERTLIVWAISAWGISVALFAWPDLTRLIGGMAAAPPKNDDLLAQILAGFQSSSYPHLLRANLQALLGVEYGPPITGMLAVFLYDFGFFLLGLWAGRRRLFGGASVHRTLFQRAVRVALPAGVVAGILLKCLPTGPDNAPTAWLVMLREILYQLSWILTALGYIAAATLLLERVRWQRWLSSFAPVGRMALTNYLAQSVICTLIFYGGGLVGRNGPAVNVGIACLIFPVQLLYSRWWLARFRFGPMEWVWRSLAYGRVQPMRRVAEEGLPVAAGAV